MLNVMTILYSKKNVQNNDMKLSETVNNTTENGIRRKVNGQNWRRAPAIK